MLVKTFFKPSFGLIEIIDHMPWYMRHSFWDIEDIIIDIYHVSGTRMPPSENLYLHKN